jgi:hypothetical protein
MREVCEGWRGGNVWGWAGMCGDGLECVGMGLNVWERAGIGGRGRVHLIYEGVAFDI